MKNYEKIIFNNFLKNIEENNFYNDNICIIIEVTKLYEIANIVYNDIVIYNVIDGYSEEIATADSVSSELVTLMVLYAINHNWLKNLSDIIRK